MKVLVACEYSGTVRDAFSRLGWDAWSCDLLPTESELTLAEGKHHQGDVLDFIGSKNWDLMIGHPPCNAISFAGTQVWNAPGRVYKRLDGLKFFADLWEAPIPYICLENPKSCASPVIAKYSQEIQPYYFGDQQLKTTWLWLKNLPKLKYTMVGGDLFDQITAVDRPKPISVDNTTRKKKRYFTDASTRSAKERARFWPGIAKAMAEQWTEYILNQMEQLNAE
jgi:hypothetical protein